MAGTYRMKGEPPKPGRTPATTPAPGPAEANPRSGEPSRATAPPERLVSLDAYRGLIMSVLAASGFGIANFARLPEDAPVWQEQSRALWQSLAFHFEHPVWDSKFGLMGVSAWDLIQPAFMFMVGTAMPFSDARRRAEGQSALNRWSHALLRAVVLVLLGVFLYSLRSERTNWIFTNVLAQIGLGYFFAYVLLGRRDWFQWTALAAVLGGYWWFFQQYELPQGYDLAAVSASAEKGEVFEGKSAPWSKNANAAHAFDVMFLNLLRHPPEAELQAAGAAADATSWAPDWLRQIAFNNTEVFQFNSGGYQTLNFVPSIGTTLLGILCGQLIQRRKKSWRVFGMLLAWGALCMVLGLAAAEFACPIVKRIWTPSWVLFSGAYVIWILAACYALFDLLPLRWLAFPLAVVGMNSLAMYLMGQLMHGWTRDNVVGPHLNGLLQTMFGAAALGDDMYGRLIEPTAVFVVFWLIAYWMFRQRYFLRI